MEHVGDLSLVKITDTRPGAVVNESGDTMIASKLVAASALVVLAFGSLHLLYTFNGPKLHPRDPAVMTAMQNTTPVITRETTVWRATLGFNATHSMGLMLFGLVYAYLALAHAELLWQSTFLLTLGLVTLGAYVVLAKLYFFSIPFGGVTFATLLYVAGMVLRFAKA